MDPHRLQQTEAAMAIFLDAVKRPVVDEHGDAQSVFLSVTHTESCWLHFATGLAIDSIAEAAKYSPAGVAFLQMADKIDTEMWEKIMNSVRVQILGIDPETNDSP